MPRQPATRTNLRIGYEKIRENLIDEESTDFDLIKSVRNPVIKTEIVTVKVTNSVAKTRVVMPCAECDEKFLANGDSMKYVDSEVLMNAENTGL